MKPVIFGIEGLALTQKEASFFQEICPFGFILFKRNIKEPTQLHSLTQKLRELAPHILIDQEGGRVQRLTFSKAYPSAQTLAIKTSKSKQEMAKAIFETAYEMGCELAKYNITINCAPCLDLLFPYGDEAIGDRSFGRDPQKVILCAQAQIKGLRQAGLLPVIKHMPGHGRAQCDSHKELPHIKTPLEELQQSDFIPFAALAQDSPFAITAHIVYDDIDKKAATQSPYLIKNIIRKDMGFKGVLISDDITMSALKGSMGTRAKAAYQAGCDMVLHCNGKLDEMREVANSLPSLTSAQIKKLNHFRSCHQIALT